MEKLLLFLGVLLIGIAGFAFGLPSTLPSIDRIEQDKGNYTLIVEYIKEYKQAIFIYIIDEDLFKEDEASSIVEENIEVFMKEHGYFGYDHITYPYRIRFHDGLAKYQTVVKFKMTSK